MLDKDLYFTVFLMGKKGLVCLKALINNGFKANIYKVVLAKDENVQNDYYDDIKNLCDAHSLSSIDRLSSFEPNTRVNIAISWRWLIKTNHNQSLIVFHDSLLPKYRGFAPLVNCLINKEPEIGVTALLASEEYDKGDILYQTKISIDYPIKIESAIEKISLCYVKLLIKLLSNLKGKKKIEQIKQDENEASYSIWLDDGDYRINWENSSEEIKRFIDSVGFPYKFASTTIQNRIIRILDSVEAKDVKVENRHPGKVIFIEDGLPIVICGKGFLKIKEAIDEQTNKSILPLKNFRTKFI